MTDACPNCHTPLEPFKINGQFVRGSWLVCWTCDHDEEVEITRMVGGCKSFKNTRDVESRESGLVLSSTHLSETHGTL